VPADAWLLRETYEHVVVLTLNRPHVRNAIDRALGLEIAAAVDELDASPDVRACVLTGAAGFFSSGTDLKSYAAGESPIVEPRGFYGLLRRPPRVPLIAAVEGCALGGGLEVVLACDLVVAARDATFGLPEVTHGVFAAGGAHRLALRVPYNQAMEIALTGSTFSAQRASELGLVNRLVEPGDALRTAIELANRIALNAPIAVRATKEAIARSSHHPDDGSAWELQLALNEGVLGTEDSSDGVAAFLEKREPHFRGC
jgi:enoyl-CoA hydratase